MRFLLLFCSVFFSCGGKKIPKKEQVFVVDSLIAKKQTYLELIKEIQDEHGFVYTHECDSLLWTSVAQYVGVDDINLLAARDEKTKRWYRTPSKDCYDRHLRGEVGPGTSGSDNSKDQFVGLFWAASDHLRRDEILDIWNYGKKNNWIMGRGDISRTWLSINLQNTLAILADKPKSELPEVWKFDKSSYSGVHISIMHIMLRSYLDGEISEDMFEVIEKAFEMWPDNGFFRLCYSFFKEGVDLEPLFQTLQDESLFPKDRLPNSSDRCPHYIWKHRKEHVVPCDEGHTHGGLDYLFVVKLMGM